MHPSQVEFVDGPMAGQCHEVECGFPVPDRMRTPSGHWYRIDDRNKAYYEYSEPGVTPLWGDDKTLS